MNSVPVLTADHLKNALRTVDLADDWVLTSDHEHRIGQICNGVNELRNRDHHSDEAAMWTTAIAHLVDICVVADLVGSPTKSVQIAMIAARSWMRHSQYLVAATPLRIAEMARIVTARGDNFFLTLCTEIGRCAFDRATATMFEQIAADANEFKLSPLEPIRGFIAVAMTGVDDVNSLKRISQTVARIAGDAGIVCFQPIVEHDPGASRAVADDPLNHGFDEKLIANADWVAIITDPVASGLGAVNELARRYGARRVLFNVSDKTVSPMLTGALPLPAQISLDGERFEAELRRLILSEMPKLEQVRQLRQIRLAEGIAYHQKIHDHLSSLDKSRVEKATPTIIVDRDRFRHMIENADVLSGISMPERLDLERSLAMNAFEEMPLEAWRAALAVEAAGVWPESATERIVEQAMRTVAMHLAEEGESAELVRARVGWGSPEWWMNLWDEMNEH